MDNQSGFISQFILIPLIILATVVVSFGVFEIINKENNGANISGVVKDLDIPTSTSTETPSPTPTSEPTPVITPTPEVIYVPITPTPTLTLLPTFFPTPRLTPAPTYVPPVSPPTVNQLSWLRRLCLASPEIASVCAESIFMPSYYSNLTFRTLVDGLVDKYHAFLSDQEQQKIASEIKILDCIMAPTPEDERLLDPATQNYLRQIRCGTVTNADKTNYELSRIKSSVDELKYRLETKTSFPPVLFDTLKPTDLENRWEIRWDGFGGGTIKDSTGGFYQFRCEANYCVSY